MAKEDDAAEAWGAMLQLFLGSQRPRFGQLAEREGLTSRSIHALLDLASGEGRPMSSLAEAWFCDASNVTGIVDALEKRGLAERVAHASDRRMKLVQLTEAGTAARDRCIAYLSQPPPGFLRLTASELRALRDLVTRAAAGQPALTVE